MRLRPGKHLHYFFEHEGKQVLWTQRSHGRGEIGRVEHVIRRQLKVNSAQMQGLAKCPMTLEAYVAHLKAIGVIV